MMDTPGDSSSRFEKSLGLLTTKFVTLLQEAEGGILDLKLVSHNSKNHLVTIAKTGRWYYI